MSIAAPKGRLASTGLAAVVALLLCLTQPSIARGDNTASCVTRMSSYVAELDDLLSRERNWITPFDELNERYFPFLDCDPDPLLVEATRSRFFRQITYNPRVREYLVRFSSNDVQVSFAYLATERKSEFNGAIFTRK